MASLTGAAAKFSEIRDESAFLLLLACFWSTDAAAASYCIVAEATENPNQH